MTRTIHRRTVLKGVGCALGLPLLEAMLPSRGRAAAEGKPPVRMAFVTFPNGAIMDAWRPAGEGTSFELSPTLQPLADVRGDITLFTGLAQDNGRAKGDCDSGYSCAYSNNVSWKDAATPMAKEINPRLVFERMFGKAADGKSLARRTRVRQSVLDLVSEQAADLKGRLGSADQQKVEQYFTSVREVEQR